MLQLTTLGTTSLVGSDGRQLSDLVRQPKRFALLVYLVLESRAGMVRRDTVCLHFWPDRPQAAARQALSQALYVLRRHLGHGALLANGVDEIAVDLREIRCDAVEALKALEEERFEDVARLAKGAFLVGLHVPDAPEFENWRDQMAARLQRACSQSAWIVAEDLLAAGDVAAAAGAAWRAADFTPYSDSSVRRLMLVLRAAGDQGAALDAFRQACSRGVELGVESHKLAAEIESSLRHRPNAPPGAASSRPTPSAGDNTTAPAPVASNRRHALAAAVAVAAMALLLVGGFGSGSRTAEPRLLEIWYEGLRLDEAVGGDAWAAAFDQTLLEKLAATGLPVIRGAQPGAQRTEIRNHTLFTIETAITAGTDAVSVTAMITDAASGRVFSRSRVDADLGSPGPEELANALASRLLRELRRYINNESMAERGLPQAAVVAYRLAEQEWARGHSLRASLPNRMSSLARADSLAAEAARMAPGWEQPEILRADLAIAAMWATLARGDRATALEHVEDGIAAGSRAVSIDPSAAAREVLGTLYVWKWQLLPPQASSAWQIARDSGRTILETLADESIAPARAWTSLFRVYLAAGDGHRAYHAASMAAQSDLFAEQPAAVAADLYNAAFEIADLDGARRWCRELQRFDQWGGRHCRLQLMADAQLTSRTDTASAGRLYTEATTLSRDLPSRVAIGAEMVAILAAAGDTVRATSIYDMMVTERPPAVSAWQMAFAASKLGRDADVRDWLAVHREAQPHDRMGILRRRRIRHLAEHAGIAAQSSSPASTQPGAGGS